jgi:hypothetical protein
MSGGINLNTVTKVTPQQKGVSLGTSQIAVLSNNDSGKMYKITSIIIANVDGTNDVDINVRVQTYAAGGVYIAKTVTVPADSTLVVTNKDTPIYVGPYGSLQAWASATGDAEMLITLEVIEGTSFDYFYG